jgi:hypothetical protein
MEFIKGLDVKKGETKHQVYLLQSFMLVKIVPTYTFASSSMGHVPMRLTRGRFSSSWLGVSGVMLGAITSIC